MGLDSELDIETIRHFQKFRSYYARRGKAAPSATSGTQLSLLGILPASD